VIETSLVGVQIRWPSHKPSFRCSEYLREAPTSEARLSVLLSLQNPELDEQLEVLGPCTVQLIVRNKKGTVMLCYMTILRRLLATFNARATPCGGMPLSPNILYSLPQRTCIPSWTPHHSSIARTTVPMENGTLHRLYLFIYGIYYLNIIYSQQTANSSP
jgi:hypothetical protein